MTKKNMPKKNEIINILRILEQRERILNDISYLIQNLLEIYKLAIICEERLEIKYCKEAQKILEKLEKCFNNRELEEHYIKMRETINEHVRAIQLINNGVSPVGTITLGKADAKMRNAITKILRKIVIEYAYQINKKTDKEILENIDNKIIEYAKEYEQEEDKEKPKNEKTRKTKETAKT